MKVNHIFKFGLSSALLTMTLGSGGCGGKSPEKPSEGEPPNAVADAAAETSGDVESSSSVAADGFVGKSGRTLLITQSNFAMDDKGKYVVPDSGELIMLQNVKGKWEADHIKETESNVFHKALQYADGSLFTIGANEAMLKQWQKKDGKWQSTTIWHPVFGGKHNRLRDFEMADFDKNGKADFAIATHDQGVVAVAFNKGDKWDIMEIDRKANMFVHEIEVGDIDKDGNLEIYATPSEPNTASGVDQGGGVVRYEWNGKGFDKSVVAHYDTRHIKEVLVADVDGDGTQELYAALEAEMGENYSIKTPVEIMRFDYKNGKFVEKKVASLNDRFCRFLTAGDVDGDGKTELIASPWSAGVWVLNLEGGEYQSSLIDKNTGGFEHAAYLADMNGDDSLELYIANDNGGVITQYMFVNGAWKSTEVYKRDEPKAAMVWNITVADL